jgi:hypothetical protein
MGLAPGVGAWTFSRFKAAMRDLMLCGSSSVSAMAAAVIGGRNCGVE